MKRVSYKKIEKICIELFKKKKVKKNIYTPVVRCLIEASLRGVDTHGIRLLPHYLKVIDTAKYINYKKPNQFEEFSYAASLALFDYKRKSNCNSFAIRI